MSDFIHLHNHSHYSLMDGLCSPVELLDAAKDLGQTALAITDHGTLSGHRAMQAAANKVGLKPILGVEAYISETDRFDRRTVTAREDNTQVFNHIILLAKNQTGVLNLHKLSGIAWSEGFYRKPRIDSAILGEHADGLIVLSGCMNGIIARALERGDTETAEQWMKWFKVGFGDDFYVEIQPHNPPELNKGLLEMADLYSVKPVVTSDCHFATESQRALEEALLILSTKPQVTPGKTYANSQKHKDIFERFNYLYPDRPISFAEIDVFLQSRLQAGATLAEQDITRTDVFESTLEIADKVQPYEFKRGLELLPKTRVDADKRLRKMCLEGLAKRGMDKDPVALARLDSELEIIKAKGFAPYILLVADMVKWARSKDIFVGPGRGSAAGSLIMYALEITQVDPIKYDLLFSRFINEDRNDFPDIDVDFQDSRRNEVKDYLKKKFTHVAGIATYGYFKEKGVVRDVARVFHVPLAEVNKMLKTVDSFDSFKYSRTTADFRKDHPEVLEFAEQLRGRIRGTGAHASGLVVAKDGLENYTPLESRKPPKDRGTDRIVVVANDMNEVEDIGLIKFDLLGLKNLSVIKDTIDMLKERKQLDIDMLDVPLDDADVLKMISDGHTVGVFQSEAVPSTKLIMDMGIETFDDLVASNALVRPGAMNTVGKDFLLRKHGRQMVKYAHPLMEDITKNTYGVIIYQEQVMRTCVELAGMTYSDADRIRKIIGKKKDVREFDEYKDRFVKGAMENISEAKAEKLWHEFEAHANYSFNKSHAVAYSLISYWTAYLKYHYPTEYMYAMLRHEGDKKAFTKYLIEAKRLGIEVMLPHVNKSKEFTSLEGDKIRMGLGDIKSISPEKGAFRILDAGPYSSYKHLQSAAMQKGSGINSRMIESLNAVGAAAFPDNPLKGNERDNYYEYLGIPMFSVDEITPFMQTQIVPLEEYDDEGCYIHLAMVEKIKRGKGWSRIEFVDESGSAGVFHSEQTQIVPGQMYLVLVAENRVARFIPTNELEINKDDVMLKYLNANTINIQPEQRIVMAFNPMKSKKGSNYAHMIVADQDKNLRRIIVFSKIFPKALTKCQVGSVITPTLKPGDKNDLYLEGIK